jgi:uncharacterized membrane protein
LFLLLWLPLLQWARWDCHPRLLLLIKKEMKDMEKCYGVVKAGKNDCKTLSNACAGHSMTDGQKDAFIAVPAGTCERIVGGSMAAS